VARWFPLFVSGVAPGYVVSVLRTESAVTCGEVVSINGKAKTPYRAAGLLRCVNALGSSAPPRRSYTVWQRSVHFDVPLVI